jgi:hypothetical protein
MHSFRLFVSAGIAAMLAVAPSFGQTPARVRGAVTAIDDSNITVKEWDGTIFTLKTGPYTGLRRSLEPRFDQGQRLRRQRRQRVAAVDGRGRAGDHPRRYASRAN